MNLCHLESSMGYYSPHLRAANTPLILLETVVESSYNLVSIVLRSSCELQSVPYFSKVQIHITQDESENGWLAHLSYDWFSFYFRSAIFSHM